MGLGEVGDLGLVGLNLATQVLNAQVGSVLLTMQPLQLHHGGEPRDICSVSELRAEAGPL